MVWTLRDGKVADWQIYEDTARGLRDRDAAADVDRADALAGLVDLGAHRGTSSDGDKRTAGCEPTGDAFVVAETTLQPGGFAPPLHLHREMAEVLYLLSGRLHLQVGDDHRTAVPGTFVGIPAGVAHTMSVAGEEPVKMLMILSNPARALQMIDTLEQAFADGQPDPETSGPLLARIDMELLAPAAS